ncbi:MAG: N-acyl homoserine lactonase family protein [Deltaproteobacteria bacterium]|nr:N-acyl homoserine lactonase family protein [Deltaproteobacteria bacterium]
MAQWKITPLVYGTIDVTKGLVTTGLDADLPHKGVYLGFYLTNGTQKVLVDTGINEKYIVDGKAWGGLPAEGGEAHVLKSLDEAGVSAKAIDTVLYTHLHNDHAGNCHLFPKAVHIFQDAEWKELLDPLPSMKIRRDYDPETIGVLSEMNCRRVSTDVEIFDGIRLIQTPGHTAGSQSLLVSTVDGVYVLVGDTLPTLPNAFPKMTQWTQLDGSVLSITPAPREWGPAIPSGIIYDHYAWYRSVYQIHALLRGPEFLLPGHEVSLVGKTFG